MSSTIKKELNMPIATTGRNGLLTGLNNSFGNGAKVVILAANGTTVLATFQAPTANALYGTPASSVMTLDTFVGTGGTGNTVSAVATGVATTVSIRTSADADIITGLTVGTSAAQFIIDNTSINSGQNVTITPGSCSITAPTA